MVGLAIPLLLVLIAIVMVIVIAIQRSMNKGEDKGGGADIVAYLVLALAMGVAGFALASLAATAFPGDRFVFDPTESLATSLASLAVSVPFVIYFWRRQADRRTVYPASTGWTLYLSIIELVFVTALVVSAVMFLNGLLEEASTSSWTGTVVFGAIVVFHEIASWRTPPRSDAGELQRVIGSALGLIATTAGLAGTLTALFSGLFDTMDFGYHPWLAMLIVGTPVWAYRWLRPWPPNPSLPRQVWTVVVSIGSLAVALGAATTLLVLSLQYVLTETPPAGQHFEAVAIPIALALATLPVWVIHRRSLDDEGSTARVYEYALAALGVATGVAGAIALTVTAFNRDLIVGGDAGDVIALATAMVTGLVVWQLFTRKAGQAETAGEGALWPRRLYHLGMGIVFALIAAAALISTLFLLLRRILDGEATDSLLTPITVLVYTGLAAWYLLATFARDRAAAQPEEVIEPFEVTIITSHPGMVAARFPKQARLQVIYRGDDAGPIDDDMADAIVAAVGHRPSLVWVDGEGFRVAPRRTPA